MKSKNLSIMEDRKWKVVLSSVEEYEEMHGDDSSAITLLDSKEIHFKTDHINLETVTHEISHVYMSYTIIELKSLKIEDLEEFFCDFNGKYAFNICKVSKKVFKILQELNAPV